MRNLRRLATLFLLIAVVLGALPLAVSAQAPGPDEKTLVIAQTTDVQSLDPPQVGSRTDANIMYHLFATLYEIDDFGAIVPYLAKDYRISEDGTEITFVLNEGLTCHDGEPLTAEDVVYTFERAADPANAFTGNTPGFVFASIAYKGARADSELEATIILERYQSIALGLISEVAIHCKDSYEAMSLEEAQSTAIGSGPYKFVEWVKDDYVLMEKWADFKLRDVYFDRIVWRVIPEASTRSAELMAGNVDIITNVPPDQHAAINSSGTATVVPVEGLRRIYVGINFTDNFTDECAQAVKRTDVRVALQYAVDVPTICEALLGVECERPTGLVNKPNDNPDLEPYPYDPAKAEELLDAAGYPRGADGVRFECDLMTGRDRYVNHNNVVQAVCQYLTDVGVKTNCVLMDWRAEFIPLLVEQKAGPLFFVGSGGGNWNPLYEMADFASETSNPNYGFWSNPGWFDRWRSLGDVHDPVEEKRIVNEMLEVFYNDPPWIILYMQPDYYGLNNRLDWQPRRDEWVLINAARLK
ncbi:MAG: ABC transporter substrate-binding protein [Chloroflexota bacterium]|jgi:peptide/nickel transport system substrate-binding protein